MTPTIRLLVLGGLLTLAGLCVGFRPLTSDGDKCGSAFQGPGGPPRDVDGFKTSDARESPDVNCDDQRGHMRTVAIVLLVAGGASAAVGGVVASAGKRSTPSA